MRSTRIAFVIFVLLPLLSLAATPRAEWTANGTAICTAAVTQSKSQCIPDGAGGAIIVWVDSRNGATDIYAQRVDAAGEPVWTADGVAVCTAASSQNSPVIAADGAGGAVVAWNDYRAGNFDIYAQRIDAAGSALWTADGVPACAAANTQEYPAIASDGAGGAFIVWQDYRSGIEYDVYAQRLSAGGGALWTADGIVVCNASNSQTSPKVVYDGIGGAIIAWQDARSGNLDIYAQRLQAIGSALWSANGAAVCTDASAQELPALVCDGADGAIIAWRDYRGGAFSDIYAQRMDFLGSALWTANGASVSSAANHQTDPRCVPDGSGGAVIAWHDYRNPSTTVDLYAQRIDGSGAGLWTADGVAVSTADYNQAQPALLADGSGGTIIVWEDNRSGVYKDLYAQRVGAAGDVEWTANGLLVCSAANHQIDPSIAEDGFGGAIVAWTDYRSGSYTDLYAQQVRSRGKVGSLAPAIHSVRDVPGDEGGRVNIAWDASRLDLFVHDVTEYSIWRALATAAALVMLDRGAELLDAPAVPPGKACAPVLRLGSLRGESYYWELVDSHAAYYLPGYSKIVSTAFDSCAATSEYHYFQIIAHTRDPYDFYVSDPDSGYSVDNIAPCPPAALAGEQSFAPAGLSLTWAPNEESDLDCYRVYRGSSGNFVPDEGNRLAAPCDTAWFDVGWDWSAGYWYKLSAVDVHGNESAYAVLGPDGVTGDETPDAPPATYLGQNYPNPFNPLTRIEFGLAGRANVSLRIYDASGRLVRVLVDEARPAGRYAELWDGEDGRGAAVSSGIYVCVLKTENGIRTRKLVLLR